VFDDEVGAEQSALDFVHDILVINGLIIIIRFVPSLMQRLPMLELVFIDGVPIVR
jgi:hypothetical protein